MSKSQFSQLRPHRKRSSFTQADIAFLLGLKLPSAVSRYESGGRLPDLRTALAYEIIFEAASRDLFHLVYAEVARQVAERAIELARAARGGGSDPRVDFKIARLMALVARLQAAAPPKV
jgi:transcriptional regulator with XRE-family HTH domain